MAAGQRSHRVVGRESDGTNRTPAEAFIERVRSDAKSDHLALPKGRTVALGGNRASPLSWHDKGAFRNLRFKLTEYQRRGVNFGI